MLQQLDGLRKWGHLLLQVFLGFIFVMHGAQKLFGPSFYGFPWEGYVGYFNKLGITPAASGSGSSPSPSFSVASPSSSAS